MSRYYHAGTELESGSVLWSNHTRRSFAAASREAARLSRRRGGRPLVEWWDRRHGLVPGDCELVEGAEYVGEDGAL